jgi:hypothetical protein
MYVAAILHIETGAAPGTELETVRPAGFAGITIFHDSE